MVVELLFYPESYYSVLQKYWRTMNLKFIEQEIRSEMRAACKDRGWCGFVSFAALATIISHSTRLIHPIFFSTNRISDCVQFASNKSSFVSGTWRDSTWRGPCPFLWQWKGAITKSYNMEDESFRFNNWSLCDSNFYTYFSTRLSSRSWN